jgi:hypothetical protein
LVNGFTLVKHGRSGPPKKRHFWMTNSLTRLYWDTSRVVDVLKTGDRHINMADVVSLIDGVGTDLLRKKVARGEIHSGNEGRFFSLVTTRRTFDLEAASLAQRKVLVRAFNFLINHLARPGQRPIAPIRPAAVSGGGGGAGYGIRTTGSAPYDGSGQAYGGYY